MHREKRQGLVNCACWYLWAAGKHALLPPITQGALLGLLQSHFQTPSGSETYTGLRGALASGHGPVSSMLFAAANRSIKAQLEGPWAVLEQTNS